MTRRYSLAALVVLGATAIPAAAAATTSHVGFWQNKSASVVCAIETHPKAKPASKVICATKGLPVHKHSVGDPFLLIGAHGKPAIAYLSQSMFPAGNPKTLGPGTKWSSLGVTCSIQAKTVTCHNKSGHGFTIGKGKYTHF